MSAACQLILQCADMLAMQLHGLTSPAEWMGWFGTLLSQGPTHTLKTLGNCYMHSPACPLKDCLVQSPTSSQPPDASLGQHSVDSCPPTRPSTDVTGHAAFAVGYL